jgi:hypothetical protein
MSPKEHNDFASPPWLVSLWLDVDDIPGSISHCHRRSAFLGLENDGAICKQTPKKGSKAKFVTLRREEVLERAAAQLHLRGGPVGPGG